MCRWLERDPAGYQDGPSLYSYLGRNPMAGTDPYGLWFTDWAEDLSFWWHGGKNLSGPQYHQGWRDGKRGRWKHYYVDGEIGATWWIPDHEGGNTWWTETLNAGTQLQRERIDRFQEFRRAGANALAIGAASVVVAGMTLTPGPDELIAGAVLVRVGAGAKLLNGPIVTFGRNLNQVFHAFRHTDKLGLDRGEVQSAVMKHLETVVREITPGKSHNFVTSIGGKRLQYSAYQLPDGSINVGRIHEFNPS
jgi:hypothetical protein